MDERKKLMLETLETAQEYLGQMIEGTGTISEYIQSGREDKALDLCVELIDGLKWMLDVLVLTKPIQEELGEAVDISPFGDLLRQLLEAFSNKDYVYISDLLEYEIRPVLEGWSLQLGKIVAAVGEGDARNS